MKTTITTLLRKIFPKELPKPIGRWRIEHCNTQINSKIDLSNEDHCGPCGQYALTKIKSNEHPIIREPMVPMTPSVLDSKNN